MDNDEPLMKLFDEGKEGRAENVGLLSTLIEGLY